MDNDEIETPQLGGKTIDWDDFLDPKALEAQKLLDYYDGDQLKYVIKMLDGQMQGWGKRKEWKHRGIIPRTRAIIKSIVDKSGLLFNKPPQLNIQVPNSVSPVNDPVFEELMTNADWMEIMQNVDVYTRLLGSTVVLQQLSVPDNVTTVNGMYQYDATRGDQLMINILHRGNSVVKMNAARTKIIELAYLLDGTPGSGVWHYCVWTPLDVMTIEVDNDKAGGNDEDDIESLISIEPHPYGAVPASFFYDTKKPLKCAWTNPPEDLISLQEIVNLALTDTEYAIAFQKQKTLFITGDMENDESNSGDLVVPAAMPGYTPGGAVYNDIPFYQTRKQTVLGGLGSIVKLGTDGAGGMGKAEFVGPDTNLASIDDIINNYCVNIANDWSVNLNFGGSGHAGSGFQLIVEELQNLNLRQIRAYTMQASLRRFYEITKIIFPGQLTDGILIAEFAPPSLPVNQKEQEDLWTIRIDNNRASILDYLTEEKGMTEEEAIVKMSEILEYNADMKVTPAVTVASPPKPPSVPPASGVDVQVK